MIEPVKIQLIQPTATLQSECLCIVTEFQDAGETRIYDQSIFFICDSFPTYLHQLEKCPDIGLGWEQRLSFRTKEAMAQSLRRFSALDALP